jgi:hypothetical protein
MIEIVQSAQHAASVRPTRACSRRRLASSEIVRILESAFGLSAIPF